MFTRGYRKIKHPVAVNSLTLLVIAKSRRSDFSAVARSWGHCCCCCLSRVLLIHQSVMCVWWSPVSTSAPGCHTHLFLGMAFWAVFDTEIDIVWYSEKFTNDFQDMVNSRFTWLGLVKRLPLKPIYFEPLAGTKVFSLHQLPRDCDPLWPTDLANYRLIPLM